MTNLKNYKSIQTEDGSETLYSELYGEACHSTSGAREETRLHYINGCRIPDFLEKNESINVLEIGFGTGIGLDETLKACAGKKLCFTSFEIDPELIEYSLREFDFKKIEYKYIVETEDTSIEIFCGDARKNIKKVDRKYDVIFQDAFSPRRNADLWTREWFSDLKNVSYEHCIMSTYSASSSIRKSMIDAGWKLYPGDKFGPKRTSTRARLTGETDPEMQARLDRSPAITLTDQNFKEYQNEKNQSK